MSEENIEKENAPAKSGGSEESSSPEPRAASSERPPRAEGSRSEGSRPEGSRSEGSRPEGSRSEGSRPEGSRSEGSRPEGSRADGPRSDGDRRPGGRPGGPGGPGGSGGPGGPRGGPRGGSGGGPGGGGRRKFYFRKRKFCKFRAEKIDFIDYKEVDLLRSFIPERGKIAARRQTGTSAKFQRMLATAIKRARHMALLPYSTD